MRPSESSPYEPQRATGATLTTSPSRSTPGTNISGMHPPGTRGGRKARRSAASNRALSLSQASPIKPLVGNPSLPRRRLPEGLCARRSPEAASRRTVRPPPLISAPALSALALLFGSLTVSAVWAAVVPTTTPSSLRGARQPPPVSLAATTLPHPSPSPVAPSSPSTTSAFGPAPPLPLATPSLLTAADAPATLSPPRPTRRP